MLSFTAIDILRNYLGLCVDKYPFHSSVINVRKALPKADQPQSTTKCSTNNVFIRHVHLAPRCFVEFNFEILSDCLNDYPTWRLLCEASTDDFR